MAASSKCSGRSPTISEPPLLPTAARWRSERRTSPSGSLSLLNAAIATSIGIGSGRHAAPAIAGCDRFIRTYPNHPNVDYAYYLKGLVNFREDQGVLGYLVETDLSERDPKMTKEAFGAFRELVTRFPNSKYAEDSAERMRYLTNALAGYEVHVARYYYSRGAYVAAVNRAQATLVNYPKTPANEDALVLLMESYDKLGMNQLRDDTRRVLKETFPNGRYFVASASKPWWKFW